ncbi:MAG: hypothetical protein AB7O78_19335, partial [Thermoleophilia bacterium]
MTAVEAAVHQVAGAGVPRQPRGAVSADGVADLGGAPVAEEVEDLPREGRVARDVDGGGCHGGVIGAAGPSLDRRKSQPAR